MLSRREKILGELQSEFNIKICQAYGEKMVQLFNRAKIVLNIHAEEFLDTETRIYEALGCGSFLISEKLSGENPFIAGKHYIEVNDLKMMKDQIKYYLENQTEREEIALNGYHEAINKHTYYVRAKEFTKKFEEQTLKTETPAFNSRKLNIFSIYEQFKRFIKK
jgi:spore maturation protein CgeB